jgi:hypothetical protein
MLADVAVLLHVAASLTHEPDWGGLNWKPPAGAYEEGLGRGHKQLS